MLIAIRALSYNGMKMNRDEGRVLGECGNKIILPADGHIDIARMVENFNLFMPKTGRTKSRCCISPKSALPTIN